jgi:hypothetical protein
MTLDERTGKPYTCRGRIYFGATGIRGGRQRTLICNEVLSARKEGFPMINVSPVEGMNFLTSVYARTWSNAWTYLNGTSTYEMLRLLDQIDRADLMDFLTYAERMAGKVGLARIVFAAKVVQDRAVPAGGGTSLNLDVADARAFLTGRAPLRITSTRRAR